MFEKTKAKINEFFEKHPGVKKGLKIGVGVLTAVGAGYGCYTLGMRHENLRNRIELNNKEGERILEVLKKYTPEEPVKVDIPDIPEIPVVPDKHSFDMMFRDIETGTKYTAKDSCLGSYVNDMLSGFADTPIEIVVEKSE